MSKGNIFSKQKYSFFCACKRISAKSKIIFRWAKRERVKNLARAVKFVGGESESGRRASLSNGSSGSGNFRYFGNSTIGLSSKIASLLAYCDAGTAEFRGRADTRGNRNRDAQPRSEMMLLEFAVCGGVQLESRYVQL